MASLEVSNEVRRTALNNALTNITNEMYSLCLMLGVDPDAIDTADPLASSPQLASYTEAHPAFYSAKRVIDLCAAHVLATNKLESLPPTE